MPCGGWVCVGCRSLWSGPIAGGLPCGLQLVSFARAAAVDAELVGLDEATGSVDPMTEYLLKQALVQLYETRTVIAITLRLSTVHRADRIVVLDAREVVEAGTHAELVRLGGAYTLLLLGEPPIFA